jgi:hypothetical protein
METQKTVVPIAGVEYDTDGKPAGYTVNELFDELDKEFVSFYGEYGRRMVNARRTEWNKQGPWTFSLFE